MSVVTKIVVRAERFINCDQVVLEECTVAMYTLFIIIPADGMKDHASCGRSNKT